MIPGFYISTDKSKLDLNVIEDYLSNHSYWAKGRSRNTIERSIANSLCFGVYSAEHKQVGFARVVSDLAVFAFILDVFILDRYQRQGLGKLLMQGIIDHPELQGMQRWGLGTLDAHGLYEKFGFRIAAHPERVMEIINPPR